MKIQTPRTFIDYSLWFIVCLVFINVVSRIRIILNISNFVDMLSVLTVLLFFLSAILSVIGILLKKNWGFISTYVYIVTSTYFLGICVIPFIFGFISIGVEASTKIIVINAIILLFTIFVHILVSNKKVSQKTSK